ncbi:urease accessory protein UreD [Nakamurella sp. YIM 132087]|uniref:Urease accessory protein UreD n=1 Tax=Nakamurella alba TaxID=2665158 RepID=A0A7K1FNC2_9ACTN|nr:urease accessory protein UreD [Nakamurella alba]MTD15580.1 urease accessory protein UreD [Nakamurella alba]
MILAPADGSVAIGITPDATGVGRASMRLRPGLLAPRVLSADATGARIALVATEALLLPGDTVRLDVEVADGGRLEIVETAGTVAYDGAGEPSWWTVRIRLGVGARLRWHGEPFVVADGARVTRTLDLEAADGAEAVFRETLVLGRTGELGGDLLARTRVTLAGEPLLLEDLDLQRSTRGRPGLLGSDRVVDSVLVLGRVAGPVSAAAGERFDLHGPGTVLRWTGRDLHRSPAPGWWTAVRAAGSGGRPGATDG